MSCIEGGSIEPVEPPFATGLLYSILFKSKNFSFSSCNYSWLDVLDTKVPH